MLDFAKYADSFKSFVWGKIKEKIEEKRKEQEERKKVLKVFCDALNTIVKQQIGKEEMGMIEGFAKEHGIYDLINRSMLITEKDEAIKQLTISFRNYSRGTFESDFNYDECVQYATKQVIRECCDNTQQNLLGLNEKFESASSNNKKDNLPSKHIEIMFANQRDRVLREDCYYDYDDGVKQVEALWRDNHITQIVGSTGSGKKQIVAHLPLELETSIFINAALIKTKKELLSELNRRCFPEQVLSEKAIYHYFSIYCKVTIVLLDIKDADAELIDFLNGISCKVIMTSISVIIPNAPAFIHNLPNIDQGIQIYTRYRSGYLHEKEKQIEEETVREIIGAAGRIPECIRYIALYQSYINDEISLMEFAAAVRNINTKITGAEEGVENGIFLPLDYVKKKLLPKLDISDAIREVLQVVSIFPERVITKRLLQQVIEHFEGNFSLKDLVSKGLGMIEKIDNCELFKGSQLICDALEKDEDVYSHLALILFPYMQSFACSYYELKEIFEACEISDMLYHILNENEPNIIWSMLLIKKAELYELIGMHRACIDECYRILSIPGMDDTERLTVRTKVTLSRALAGYENYPEANEIIQSISEEQMDEEDRAEIEHIREMIDFGEEKFKKQIIDIKTNLSNDPYEKVAQFHQLATLNYYSGQADAAKEYFNLAKSLIEELQLEDTILASQIYAAGSAIYMDASTNTESIIFGKKSVEIAEKYSSGTNSHILTSYNNLGNAYLMAGQYELAIECYSFVISNYRDVLSSSSPMIVSDKTNMELSRLLSDRNYDKRAFEHLAIEMAKKKRSYLQVVRSIVSVGTTLAERGDLAKLKELLEITQRWVFDFTQYPEKSCWCRIYNRLAFAEAAGHMYLGDISKVDPAQTKNYKALWEMIKKGAFENEDEELSEDKKTGPLIPVFTDVDSVETGTLKNRPLYRVLPEFPPKDAYMGYIMPDDSMLPKIQKGDIVWIKKQKEPKTGNTVIYCTNDECKWLCRKITNSDGKKLLAPNNKQFGAIILGEQEQRKYCGTMIKVN